MIRSAVAAAVALCILAPAIFAGAPAKSIILATTTSTRDSGLLDYLLPDFTSNTGVSVKVVAVGSGAALKMGLDGDADVLLTHDPANEKLFLDGGNAGANSPVMHNDFVLLGPKDYRLPAAYASNAKAAFAWIASNAVFVSRGDKSGTHMKELSAWKASGAQPASNRYVSTGRGMGDVLSMTSEMKAYTLSDRATWLNMEKKLDLVVVCENDPSLFNPYRVMTVNPKKNAQINAEGAKLFFDWIVSSAVQKKIGEYGVKEFGRKLFTPDAPVSK
jgi:tungstate transport system substrate-binding protein